MVLRDLRPVVLAGLVVLGLTLTPWAITASYPPAGTTFLGTFYYVDDFFNYLSFAQQAEGGAFLFTNKAILADHAPALMNLEWWMVGLLSRLLGGGHLLLAYRIFGVLAVLGFLVVADRWLQRLGLDEEHRLPALLLVATGGGLGGFLFTFAGRGLTDCLDLFTGLFPFVGFLTNPHFTAGTALLLLCLLLHDTAEGARGMALATLAATALALVRPYDVVLLVLIRGTAVLLLEPARLWLVRLVPLLGLLPVTAYLYWLFYRNPAFAFYSGTAYVFPQATDFLWALGPAVILAVPGALTRSTNEEARRLRVHLAVWAGFAVLVIAMEQTLSVFKIRPVGFSLQFLVGVGFPLLALGAVGLRRFGPPVTLLAAALFAMTLATALRFVLTPRSFWLTGRETMAVVETLRTTCRKGDVLFAPPDVGLFAYGLTACRSFLSHRISPDYDERVRQMERFSTATPAERQTLLDAYHVRHLVLPGDPGPTAEPWLGPDSSWTRVSSFGTPPRLSLFSRP